MVDHRVLIVEDDAVLSHAMSIAAKKLGYEAVVCSTPGDALKELDRNHFKIAFIDCLLPQMPGVDLAKKIRESFDAQILPIVMMSGVFIDRQWAKDVVRDVGAINFLKKPFEAQEIIRYLEREAEVINDRDLLQHIFSLPDRLISENPDKVLNFQSIKKIDGFLLPLLLTVASRHGFSGNIQLVSQKGGAGGKVYYYKGQIIKVETSDHQSHLGELLLSDGWILNEDLKETLKEDLPEKLGDRLVRRNLVSPHAVRICLIEQMAIRIAQLVQDHEYHVYFDFKPAEPDQFQITDSVFYEMISDCIAHRVPSQWLATEFGRWVDYQIRVAPEAHVEGVEHRVGLLKDFNGWPEILTEIPDFSALQKNYETQIDLFLRRFYYLICVRFVSFGEKIVQISEAERLVRLQRIWSQLESATLIEAFRIMGGTEGASVEEVQQVVDEFKRRFVGGKPENEFNKPLRDLYQNVKTKISQVVELATDPVKWKVYRMELEKDKMSQRTQAQLSLDRARKHLELKQYSNAIVAINSAFEFDRQMPEAKRLLVWAKIGLLNHSKNKSKDLQEIEILVSQMSREDKISAEGHLVLGLLSKAKMDPEGARNHFKMAISLDPSLIEARRELNALPSEGETDSVNILHADLGQVIGKIFKR